MASVLLWLHLLRGGAAGWLSGLCPVEATAVAANAVSPSGCGYSRCAFSNVWEYFGTMSVQVMRIGSLNGESCC